MAVRYPIAVLAAYVVFLGLIRLWLAARQYGLSPEDTTYGDTQVPLSRRSFRWSRPGVWDVVDALSGLDELALLLLLVVGVLSIAFVVWNLASLILLAPDFFTELLLDGAIGITLSRGLMDVQRRGWLYITFTRTRETLVWLLVWFTFAGIAGSHVAPEARSTGGLIRHFSAPDRPVFRVR